MEGHTPKIEAVKRNESDFCLGNLSYYYQESGNNDGIPYQEISQEQAEAMAETVKGQLGLENWSLWYASDNSDETKNEYILTYTPTFSGIQTILGPQIDLQSEDLYAASYYYSELTIYIQNGVLTGITLISPFDVVSVENENVSLLSFDEVYQRFRTHMETAYNVNDYLVGFEEIPGFEDLSREVKISGVRQGLFRIKERNNDREFIMVPVWLLSG